MQVSIDFICHLTHVEVACSNVHWYTIEREKKIMFLYHQDYKRGLFMKQSSITLRNSKRRSTQPKKKVLSAKKKNSSSPKRKKTSSANKKRNTLSVKNKKFLNRLGLKVNKK